MNPDAAPGRQRRRPALLAFAAGGAPTAWALQLGISYLIVPESCRWGTSAGLHAVSLVTLAVAGAATVTAYRVRAAAGGEDSARLVGTAGLIVGAIFTVAILAGGLLPFLVDPCR